MSFVHIQGAGVACVVLRLLVNKTMKAMNSERVLQKQQQQQQNDLQRKQLKKIK